MRTTTRWPLTERKVHGSCSFKCNHFLIGVLTFFNPKNSISHDPLYMRQHRANISCEWLFEAYLLIRLIWLRVVTEFKFNFNLRMTCSTWSNAPQTDWCIKVPREWEQTAPYAFRIALVVTQYTVRSVQLIQACAVRIAP